MQSRKSANTNSNGEERAFFATEVQVDEVLSGAFISDQVISLVASLSRQRFS